MDQSDLMTTAVLVHEARRLNIHLSSSQVTAE